ncbi:MAG: lamin tail domain-containing protein [Candidatus Bipolaricaulota bacterium]|nr:lamin tail domain-containing protein [Candidatus Bipolaricaulota bacterium]
MLQHGCTRVVVAVGLLLLATAAALAATPAVVLNEVAWGGTAAGGQDEWIELRNCTASTVDLSGWVLTIGDARIPLSVAEESTVEVRRSTIEPNGFLLLERTDDTTVSDVAADILYKGSLANSGADLALLDAAGNVVDQVISAATGWPAGCGSEGDVPYATMERVDPIEMGSVWRTNDGLVTCGLDALGNPTVGTPRAANSATVDYLKTPRVQLLSPVAGDAACPLVIQWQAVDPDGLAAGLQITVSVRAVGTEEWTLLVENLANQGDFPWDCSSFPKGVAYEVRVSAADWEDRVGTATSGSFTLR